MCSRTSAHSRPRSRQPISHLAAAPLALLDLSKGRYRDAFERLGPITREDRLALGTLMLADFIDAAARSGQHSDAVATLERLAGRATAGDGRLGLRRRRRWAYHAGITGARGHTAPTRHVETAVPQPALAPTYLDRADQAWSGTRWESTTSSARSGEVLAAVMTLASWRSGCWLSCG